MQIRLQSPLDYLPTRIPALVHRKNFGGSEGGVFRPYAHAVVYLLKEKKFREQFGDNL